VGDDVEVGVEGVPGPALDVLAEARCPVRDGQVVGLRDIETRRGAVPSAGVSCPTERAVPTGPHHPQRHGRRNGERYGHPLRRAAQCQIASEGRRAIPRTLEAITVPTVETGGYRPAVACTGRPSASRTRG